MIARILTQRVDFARSDPREARSAQRAAESQLLKIETVPRACFVLQGDIRAYRRVFAPGNPAYGLRNAPH
jgi:hypothetical protein